MDKSDLEEDINYLRSYLEDYHAGMYRFTSKQAMNAAYDNYLKTLSSKSLFQFESDVLNLLTLIQCGHTRAGLSEAVSQSYLNELKRIPFDIEFINGEMYVSESFDNTSSLSRGDKILSINGHSVETIKKELFQFITTDGIIESFKYEYLKGFLWLFYPMFMSENGLIEEYKIEYLQINSKNIVTNTLKGLSPKEVQGHKSNDQDSTDPLTFDIRENYALLKIKTFSGSAHRNYYGKLKKGFQDINKAKVPNLIIDLRDNGGGRDMYGATLVSYLAQSGFKYFESIQVTDTYASENSSVTSRDGINYMTNHEGLSSFEPSENAFEGNVIVLINGRSFSTTTDVAAVLHNNGWATFIGQETGGGYTGNTSGRSNVIDLPNTRIRVNVPMWTYYTALEGDYLNNRGIIPDYITSPTLDEFLNGTDVEMQMALELIKK